MKGCFAFLGVMVVVLAVAAAAAMFFFSKSLAEREESISVPHVDGSAIRVETANGRISVREGSDSEVAVQAKIKAASEERLAEVTIKAEREADGTLDIRAQWPGGKRKMREGCSFEITVPDGVAGVALKSSNGKVEIAGLGGDATLTTSNGAITVDSHDGNLTANTSNGRIKATGINGSVVAGSSNGGIEISLGAASTGPVEVSTSNGSIDLDLGAGFTGELTLTTSNGSIKTGDANGANVVESSRRRVVLHFGDHATTATATRSSAGTSNGSINVRRQMTAPAPASDPVGIQVEAETPAEPEPTVGQGIPE